MEGNGLKSTGGIGHTQPYYEHAYTIRISRELKNGNQGRSKHWSAAHKERDQFRLALSGATVVEASTGDDYRLDEWLAWLNGLGPREGRQGLVVRRILGPRQSEWDADSILRGNAKELIDSLIEFGVAPDDSVKHIEWVLGAQDPTRREDGPAIEVEVWWEDDE